MCLQPGAGVRAGKPVLPGAGGVFQSMKGPAKKRKGRDRKARMNYKLTLLKDLPDYPAGTQFRYSRSYRHSTDCEDLYGPIEFMGLLTDKHMYNRMLIPENIIDDPEWIRKDVDHTKSIDLKCPVCGETRGTILVCGCRGGDAYDGYYCDANVFFEYDCGHGLRQLYQIER